MHNIKGVHEPRKGNESDSSKIACGFSEGSLAKRGLPKHTVHLLQCKGSSKRSFPLWCTQEKVIFQLKCLNSAILCNVNINPSIYPSKCTFNGFPINSFFLAKKTCYVDWSPETSQKQRRAHGQRKRKSFTLHFVHIQLRPLSKPCSGNNNYYLKRIYFCINLKGYIFFFPSSLCGLTYPKYLHKSPVTVNMYSTIQSSISYQVRVKTEGEMSA